MSSILIKNTTIVNGGKTFKSDVLIRNDRISKISPSISDSEKVEMVIDAKNYILIPGVIDDQVHFREPGLSHKGDLLSESKAAAAGGITSFMEMPNTSPQTVSISEINKKFELASEKAFVNYSFYLGATNSNINEISKIDPKKICGVKVFMGSSTGNMLVDDEKSLSKIFAESPTIVATHCEDETIVKTNLAYYQEKFGDKIPFKYHPVIRSAEACYKSSSFAAELASKYNTQLHILHLSSAKELTLLDSDPKVETKRITGEVCVHHLWFNENDYDRFGSRIKWNPAIKSVEDQQQLFKGLLDNKLDVIATDHAPHTLEEKSNPYTKAPSGGPLVQHSLVAMLEFYHKGMISLEFIVQKMCHAPSILYKVKDRGFIREGFKADLVLLDLNSLWTVEKNNILYKCKWSPFENYTFKSKVKTTIVNGTIVYSDGKIITKAGEALEFLR